MKDFGVTCDTTLTYSRTMRKSGTELAGCIEHYRRVDTSGITIVFVCGVLVAAAIAAKWVLA